MKSAIRKYSFKQGLPQEFELVGIGELYKQHSDTLTTPHRTGFYHILLFQKGNSTHLVDFNPIKIKPNTILFLNRDTVQRFDKKGGFDGKAILFTDNFFCKTERDTKYLQSNILFTDISLELAERLLPYLAECGIRLTSNNYQSTNGAIKRVRWVCHLQISSDDIEQTLQHVTDFARLT